MKYRAQRTVRKELKQVGASDKEVTELAAIADRLRLLSTEQHPVAARRSRRMRWVPISAASLAGLAFVLVLMAQTGLPGSRLYPIQKLSDNVAVSFDSNYRGTVMMKRAQQVQQLVARHAPSQQVLAALADYTTEASTYKLVPKNYAIFESCEASLRQATQAAVGPERQAINNALLSVQNV